MKVDGFSLAGTLAVSTGRENEDRYGYAGKVVVVADGMGGLEMGDVAADIVVKTVCALAESCGLGDLLDRADEAVTRLSCERRVKMGAAVAVVEINEKSVDITWQGNVRVYLLRKDVLWLMTRDHVLDDGFGRKRLTRCIKGRGLVAVPIVRASIEIGDKLLIATDGCYEHVSESILRTADVAQIRDASNGTEDDATCIVVEIANP